jgi:hypothetical protein
MYLLSTGSTGGFTEADKTAVRAVTEAGIAALASDINSSPVSLGPALLSDTRLKDAIEGPALPPDNDPDAQSLQDVFEQVANEALLGEHPRMSMAIVDKAGNVLARTGLSPELFDDLAKMPAIATALAGEEAELLSATLGGKLHAVKLSRPVPDAQNRRLVTINAVELGGGSFFRRVVGTQNPSGLVRDGQVIGEVIGGAKGDELNGFVTQHLASIPPREGASAVFQIGEGGNARIGAAARVPGPAGSGDKGTIFVVLSSHTLGSTQQDMATALRAAIDHGGIAQLNWILVGGLLVISLVLTFYLPYLEYNTPIRRLRAEFNAITEARQHELHHDTYGGEIGLLARAATTAMEALRLSWENEMNSDPDAVDAPSRRTRSTRSLRAIRRTGKTRGHAALGSEDQPVEPVDDSSDEGIDLPGVDPKPAKIERHAAAEAPRPAPAPTLSDDLTPRPLPLSDTSDSLSIGDMDDRETYYRHIYDEFVETKVACGEPTEGFTYDKFAKKLRKQSDTLMSRDDVADVQFSVYVKDGKAALRAKVIKG